MADGVDQAKLGADMARFYNISAPTVSRIRRRTAPASSSSGRVAVTIDTDKIDETVLALLHLTLHDRARAWKGHDWEALNRLHRKGMIDDPVGKAKSVVLTDQGLAESERLFRKLFARAPGA